VGVWNGCFAKLGVRPFSRVGLISVTSKYATKHKYELIIVPIVPIQNNIIQH
jgi:hypothetical protein